MAVIAIHPGEHLAEELCELEMSAAELARRLDVPTNRITEILNGRRAITGDAALRLAHFSGTTPEFWLNLQGLYEIRLAERKSGKSIRTLPTLRRANLARAWVSFVITSPHFPTVCHPVYNDAGVVKAHFSLDVLRPTLSPQQVFFSAKHSGGSLLCNSSLLWNPAVDPRWFHQPSIRQLLPGSLLRSPLRLTGRRAAHSSVRFGYRFPQDDPGLPACRTSSAYVHSLRSIQYNLIANRRATITLATARLPLRTHKRL